MKSRRRGALSGLVTVAVLGGASLTMGVGSASADTTPPWEPDSNAAAPYGSVSFYNSSGDLLTGGSDLTHIADYAAASTDGGATDGGAGAKATMFFATPTFGSPTGSWPAAQASTASTYPNASAPDPIKGPGFTHPVAAVSAANGNLATYVAGHPTDAHTGYVNMVQVRVSDIGPGGGSGANYWETDILVDTNAGTWQVIYPAPPAVPDAPTIDSAAGDDGSVTLNWTPGAAGSPDDYRVSYMPATGGAPTVTDLSSTNTSTTINGLTNGTRYTFSVGAHNSNGWSPYSATVDAYAGGQLTGLALAGGLASAGADHHAVLSVTTSWNQASIPTGATGIQVCTQPSNALFPALGACPGGTKQDLAPSATSTMVSGLAAGTAYRAIARPTYNSASESGGPASATIPGSTFVNPAKKTITFGGGVTLSTKLIQTGTATTLKGKPVQLWQKKAGTSAFSQIAGALTTNSSGVVSKTLKPTVNTTFQWRYGGSNGHMSTVGSEQVMVAFKLTAHLSKTSTKTGTAVKLYGTVSPSAVGQSVFLVVNGHTTATKATIKSQTLPNGQKAVGYVLTFKPSKKGKFHLAAHKPASSKNAAGNSPALTLTAT